MDPSAISGYNHIHVAAEWRIPQVHRRWPATLDLAHHIEGVDSLVLGITTIVTTFA
jgi:hypothetical protein